MVLGCSVLWLAIRGFLLRCRCVKTHIRKFALTAFAGLAIVAAMQSHAQAETISGRIFQQVVDYPGNGSDTVH